MSREVGSRAKPDQGPPGKIKKTFILTFVLAYAFLAHVAMADTPIPAYSGVQDTLTQYLCTPTIQTGTYATTNSSQSITGASNGGTTNAASGDLYNCVNKLYRFAIVGASIVSVFMIILAGYFYMSADGNSEAVAKAKSIIGSTIAAMVVLLAGFLFLKALNPDLIEFHNIQPTAVTPTGTAASIPSTGAITPGATTGTVSASETALRASFASSGITINKQPPATTVAGMLPGTINEVLSLKSDCGCSVVITGGTEPGHAETGTCNHVNGYKVDVGLNGTLNNFIETDVSFKKIANRTSDNAQQWQHLDTQAVYALESDHWDIAVCMQ